MRAKDCSTHVPVQRVLHNELGHGDHFSLDDPETKHWNVSSGYDASQFGRRTKTGETVGQWADDVCNDLHNHHREASHMRRTHTF